MKKWHGTPGFPAPTRGKATPLHNVEDPSRSFSSELWSLQEIIAVISIAHDDIFPSGRQNSTHEVALPYPLSRTLIRRAPSFVANSPDFHRRFRCRQR